MALGDIASFARTTIQADNLEGHIRYVGLEHIPSGGKTVTSISVGETEITSSKFQFNADDVLFGKLRPYLAKVAIPGFDGICSTDIIPIRPTPAVNGRYLMWHLLTPEAIGLAESRSTGANLPRLAPSELAKFPIHLPPLPEQRRIAAILDQADTLRSKRIDAIAHLNALAQSTFTEMFGDLAREPLGPKLSFVTSGGRGWAKFYTNNGQRFIRSLDVRMNSMSTEKLALVSPPQNAEAERTKTRMGDVLLTITGSRIGRAATLPDSLAASYISQHVAILRPKQEALLPEVLSAFLCAESFGQRQILMAQYGQTKPGLNFDQIRQFSIPAANIELQREFVEQVRRSACLEHSMMESTTQLKALFASLQSRSFAGEL
ncbi:MAG: restriction endonuclease subunit S [Streptosporangiaceae bacterium]